MKKTYQLVDVHNGTTVFVTREDEPAAGDVLQQTPWGRVTVERITAATGSTYEADLVVSRG